MRRTVIRWFISALAAAFVFSASSAQEPVRAGPKVVAERKTTSLPKGPLFWHVENFLTPAAAQAAAGPTGLVTESFGKAWLVTLGSSGQTSKGANKVAEIGPIAIVNAPEYLLQLRESTSKPGAKTPVHTHPGSEAFYIVSGEQTMKTSQGVTRAGTGRTMIGPEPGNPMQVSNDGASDFTSLIMFVLDANKPFSTPAEFR